MRAKMNSPGRVLRAIDGDTLLCHMMCPCCRVTSEQRVRLARIDAPELRGRDRAAAESAKRWLSDRLKGQHVLLSVTRQWPDKYGRVLAEVIHLGQNISNELMRAGHATPYTRPQPAGEVDLEAIDGIINRDLDAARAPIVTEGGMIII